MYEYYEQILTNIDWVHNGETVVDKVNRYKQSSQGGVAISNSFVKLFFTPSLKINDYNVVGNYQCATNNISPSPGILYKSEILTITADNVGM